MNTNSYMDIRNLLKGKRFHLIPYAHTDYAWTHYRQWHVERYLLILQEVLDIMETDPQFIWMVDNIHHVLLPFFQHYPDRVEELKKRVLEGRLEITNGVFSLLRPTQAAGETFIRNLVQGKKFLQKLMPGYNTQVYHNVDVSIGHSQMPQLLRLGGYRYYRAWRPQGAMDAQGFPREFRWEGLDGTDILCSRGTYAGLCGIQYINTDYSNQEKWASVVRQFYEKELAQAVERSSVEDQWLAYGMDDTRPLLDYTDEPVKLVEFMEEWNKRESSSLAFSTAESYFSRLEENPVPTVSGVLDGCDVGYNTPTKGEKGLWRARQIWERSLLKAETLWAFAAMENAAYPEEDLKKGWELLLGIWGHAMDFLLKEDGERLYRQAWAGIYNAEELVELAKRKIAEAFPANKQVIVLNTLSWEREEILPLRISFPKGTKDFELVDMDGRMLEYQICKTLKGDVPYQGAAFDEAELLVRTRLPAMGQVSIEVRPSRLGSEKENFGLEMQDIDFRIQGAATQRIDTGVIRVEFSCGKIIKVVDKAGKILFPGPNAHDGFHDLQFTGVHHHSKAAWLFFSNYRSREHFEAENWSWREYGPLVWKYVVNGRIGDFKACQEITVTKGSSTIDFTVEIMCLEPQTGFFSAAFSADPDPEIQGGIPFGYEDRFISREPYGMLTERAIDNIERNWEGLFYAEDWVRFQYPGAKAALIGESTGRYYLYDKQENSLSLILTRMFDLKKSDDWVRLGHPDLECVGRNRFSYSFHIQTEAENSVLPVIRMAKEKIMPPEVITKPENTAGGESRPEAAWLQVEGESVVVSAFYREEGTYRLRLYETCGQKCHAAVTPGCRWNKAEIVDFLGNPLTGLQDALILSERTFELDLHPWEIVTVSFGE